MRKTLAYLSTALTLAACGTSALIVNDDAGTNSDGAATVHDFAGLDLTGVIFDFTTVNPGADLTTKPPGPDLTSTTVTNDLAVTKPVDMTPVGPADLTANGVMCGNGATCKVTEKCCVMQSGMTTTSQCLASCPDGNFAAACDGPEDCSGNPCCIPFQGGAPSGSMCTTAPNDCPPAFSGFSGQTRACHVDGDCTAGAPNTTLNLCCTATMNGNTGHICLNKTIAGFIGATCP